jgi:hypothetical protein
VAGRTRSRAPYVHDVGDMSISWIDPAQVLEKSPMSAPSEFGLFLAVLFAMGLHGVIRVARRVNNMAPCGMSMVCRLFMVSRLMMLGGFRMVTRGVRKVL